MATTVFNLSAVDRIEAIVRELLKVLEDLVSALGGGDQPAIDAAAAALRQMNANLSAAVERDKDT